MVHAKLLQYVQVFFDTYGRYQNYCRFRKMHYTVVNLFPPLMTMFHFRALKFLIAIVNHVYVNWNASLFESFIELNVNVVNNVEPLIRVRLLV
ncbi:MAG: hypothetical protein BWY22_00482 [Bacteroidetes bacterium ADurb.Bin217]|nr:MAG: hypothetical protein BWY22_00482 [Bacteroidetes bacterium ADurb.Bin217]